MESEEIKETCAVGLAWFIALLQKNQKKKKNY